MELTETQKMIRDMAREFAQKSLLPGAEARSNTKQFPANEIAEMGKLGLMGMLMPEEFGGAGADYVSMVLAIEEVAAADASISTIMSVQNSLAGSCVLTYGNDAQKEKYLHGIATGELITAFGLTEAHAGSDAGAIRTRAVKGGDHYVINGSKQFISSGKNGQLAIVFAVTDSEAGKKGISAFIVPTDTKGYIVSNVEEKMGQHATDTAALVFEDMKVPAENLLGAEGKGYAIALSNLESGRLGIAAQSVGIARTAYEVALQYAHERESFGKPIMQHQAVGFRLTEMATKLEAARLMVWNAARLKDAGVPCLKEAAMAKLFASEASLFIIENAIQTLGGYGYLQDFPLARLYGDARVCTIYEGTSDIQRLIIGREISKEVA